MTLGPDDPVPVDRAVELFYPAGGIKPSTLFIAIREGTLPHEKHGRRYFITRTGFDAWRETCRKTAKAPGSGSTSARAANRSGSSGTGDFSEARDMALMNARKLKKRLPITSPAAGQTQAAGIPMRSGLPKC